LFDEYWNLCWGVRGPGRWVRAGELLRWAGMPGWDVRDRVDGVRIGLLL
jgi:hypothetical protein